MKFSNGCWLNKPGYKIYSPQEVYSTKIEEDILTIYAPCNKINTRGDTLGGPVITYKISSPMKNVIRVRAYHYMGQQKKAPSFDIYEDKNTKVLIEDNEKEVLFESGNLKMVINKDLWEMSFHKGEKKLTLCMSGFGFWSHDIGGFESTATADVYKRWVAFGLLSSHSRLHGSSSYRVPWLYDEEACDVVRAFTKLKCRIMPYLYNISSKTSKEGIPVMRSMVLEFQDDPACSYLDKQYMLGDSILVAPIFNEEGEANYYLPEGNWTNFISGKKYEGGRGIKETHNYLSVPMMVKENSLIAIGSEDSKPDYDYRNNVSILAYELKDNIKANTTVRDMKGNKTLQVEVLKEGNKIIVESTGIGSEWTLVLKNVSNITKVDGGEFTIEGEDAKILLSTGNCKCICYLN